MTINSALNAPASLSASSIATISVAVVPVSFKASTRVWSSIPGSKNSEVTVSKAIKNSNKLTIKEKIENFEKSRKVQEKKKK